MPFQCPFNGSPDPVKLDLFFQELLYNILGGISIFAWSVATCLVLFGGLKWINCLRVTREEELMGLDISKHKELAYPSAGWDDSSQLCRDNPSL